MTTQRISSHQPVTHYQTLGVAPSASLEQIRKAYRTLMKTVHPDHLAGMQASAQATGDAGQISAIEAKVAAAEARAKRINAAYKVLSDPAKRAVYDQRLLRERQQARQATQTVRPTTTTRRTQAVQTPYRGEYPSRRAVQTAQSARYTEKVIVEPTGKAFEPAAHVTRPAQIMLVGFLVLVLLTAALFAFSVAVSIEPSEPIAPTQNTVTISP